MQRQQIVVLGSTGSVGVNTLDVVTRHSDRFAVVALTALSRADVLFEQCLAHRPRYAVIGDPERAETLRMRLAKAGSTTEVLAGDASLELVVALPEVTTVMAAIVGIAGLRATFAAAKAGKRVLLANKEVLVTAGPVFMAAVRSSGALLMPIDSEHNAVFQALPRGYDGDRSAAGVRRILLTASGGPFREWPAERLAAVTPDEACAHPNWVMGRKISVDSATMMNKGLEIIEACWLFNLQEHEVDVVIHPQSVIHSLVEYIDGSLLAQLGHPDMRTPIAYALGYPDRIAAGVPMLDLAAIGSLDFSQPDGKRFACLGLARQAFRAGGTCPAALNAANEVAVAAFLESRLSFDRIPALIEHVLGVTAVGDMSCLDDVFAADLDAREHASQWIGRSGHAAGPRASRVA